MKKLLCFLMVLAVPTWVFALDVVYLRTGEIFRGTITEESGDAITLETETALEDIPRADISRIKRGVVKRKAAPRTYPEQEYQPQEYQRQEYQRQKYPPRRKSGYEAPETESKSVRAVSLSLDMPGTLTFITDSGDSELDVNAGVTLGVEALTGSNWFGWGVGFNFSLARAVGFNLAFARGFDPSAVVINDPSSERTIGYIGIPVILEISSYKKYREKRFTPYGRFFFGTNYFMPSDEFLGGAKKGGSGYLYGAGVGVRRKNMFTAELSVNSYVASLKDPTTTIEYFFSRFTVGYSF